MPEASAAKHALCRGREVRQALGALYPATLRLVGNGSIQPAIFVELFR
jgi:hypothetical protein